jgi:very-short-patch-repair endonuclease
MRNLTKEQFIEKAINIHGNEYDYSLVNYINNRININIICLKHGVFNQNPNNHLNGYICPKCNIIKKQEKNKICFIDKAKKMHENKYDYSNINYIGSVDYVNILCSIHGIFKQHANNHLSGQGCPKCGIKKRNIGNTLSTDNFIKKAKKVHGNKYDYSNVDYTTTNNYVNIICPEHGIFKQFPMNHLKGCGCPLCKESIGEKKIAEFLLVNSIKFEREKRFDNCKNIKKLAFDFFLPDNNVLIEYDGIQHFLSFNYYGGENRLCRQQINDKIKNDFAILNNYHLLRIKFDKINEINKILETYEPISRK